jgi:hypothetical protein
MKKSINFNKRKNSRTGLEMFAYEMRPYGILVISVYALAFPTHTLMSVSGGVLAVCGAIIMSWRLKERGII